MAAMAAKTPRHLCWILQNYPPAVLGGAEFATHRLTLWLQQQGWTAQVYIIPGGLKSPTDYPAEFEGVPIQYCHNLYSLQFPPGAIVCSQLWAAKAARTVAEMRGTPYIEFVHYVDATVLSPWPWTTRRNFRMVYNSEDTRRRALELAGWMRDVPTSVLPPTVWPVSAAPSAAPSLEERPWIVLVNTSEDKGAKQFAAMAAHSANEGSGRTYVGVRGAHGAQYACGDAVQILEPTLDMETVWSKARILVVPSTFETWSMVATEAMAHGIPVVAADHIPALRENCGPDAAVYVPRDATDAWLDAFARIEADYATWSAAARARVVDPTPRLQAFLADISPQ
jgi:hypothetical protein